MRPTQLIYISDIYLLICQQTNTKDVAGQSARAGSDPGLVDAGRVFPTLVSEAGGILVRFLIWLCRALRVWSLVGSGQGGLAEGSGGPGWETALHISDPLCTVHCAVFTV